MESLTITIISASIAALVSTIGYSYSQFRDRQSRCERLTSDLAQEFDSQSMVDCRVHADKEFIPRDGSEPLYIYDIYERDPASTLLIMRLGHFYKRLTLLNKHRRIDEKLARAMFGEIFTWWHEHYFIYQINHHRRTNRGWGFMYADFEWLLPEGYVAAPRKIAR